MNWIWWYLLSLGLFLGESKRVTGNIFLTTGKVNQISKFSFLPGGTATIRGNITFRNTADSARGTLYIFMDTEWQNYHSQSDHCTRMSHASAKINIGAQQDEQHINKGWLESCSTTIVEGRQHLLTFSFDYKIDHFIRTYGYYLVMGECENPSNNLRYRSFDYDIEFLNLDNNHFPADEHGLFTVYILTFIGLTIFALYGIRHQSSINGGMAKFLILFSLGIELLSILLEILHLYWYSYNGKGLFLFDFLSEVLEGLGQFSMGYLLIALGSGWTLIEGLVTMKSDELVNPEALGEDHPTSLFVCLITLFTIILQLFNKLLIFDEFSKFHDYESGPGYFLVVIRILLASFFMHQINSSLKLMNKAKGKRDTLKFMVNLRILGGLWFWSFPFLVFLSSLFSHYLRHRLVSGGVLIVQSTCLVIVATQILFNKTAYNRANIDGGTILGERF